jgi:hypothetical protein
MKVLIFFFVIISLIGCQDAKIDHENAINKIEREVEHEIVEFVGERFVFDDRKPCRKDTPNEHCRLGEIKSPVVAGELISHAKRADLKDVTIVILIDSEGNHSQLLLKDEQSNDQGKKFIVKRETLDPDKNPDPTNTYNTIAVIEPFKKNPDCVRWLYGGYNGPQGGSQYSDYCLIWQ